MIRKPFYSFDNVNSTGIDKVPVDATIQIEDSGSGTPDYLTLTSTSGITDTTTITQLYALTAQWTRLGNTYLGGTNLTLSGDTFNVDDAFLKNNADDTTTGNLTASSFIGPLTGIASQVTVSDHTANDTNYPIVWHNNSSSLYDTISKFTFNPSTGNLVASKFNGYSLASTDAINTIVLRDGSGDMNARLFRSDYATTTSLSATSDLCFRISTSDNYMRFVDRAGIISWLEDGGLNSGDYLPLSGGTITGDLTIEGTLYETSALKYKENVKPLLYSLNKVCKLQGVSYSKKATPNKQEIGLIADDVYKVVPEIVKVKDGEIEGLEYSRIVALLVESVKELKQEIEELKKI